MSTHELTDAELTETGILFADEHAHAFDPRETWWNESWFWDWFDAGGTRAGHCRIGFHPSQKRAWLWCFLFEAGEWIAVEEPRLPLGEVQLPRIAYDAWGLRFAYDPLDALRRGRLQVEGFGRVLSGGRTGQIVPFAVELEFAAAGAPHSTGRSTIPGHSSAVYDSCRFEQPTTSRGTVRIGDRTIPFEGRGERDHSWGPRQWNMEWTFIVLNGESLRLQCVEVKIPEIPPFGVGYLQRERSNLSLSEVKIEFRFDDASVERPVSGRFSVRAEDGAPFAARVEVLAAAEIDISHTFVPPARSIYRRALIRAHPDGGGAPLLGWTEFNYFPK